ncbi:MAG: hypothetical protein M2R45_01835 [Verrucomicrobia subdivision 3 bacterium]|nr:hypothetical protein [Limisphaerales bacterium]MCS1415635.1 hypothetical protein [Limisphaerales bacterium]
MSPPDFNSLSRVVRSIGSHLRKIVQQITIKTRPDQKLPDHQQPPPLTDHIKRLRLDLSVGWTIATPIQLLRFRRPWQLPSLPRLILPETLPDIRRVVQNA